MRRNITGAARISVLEPCTADICVLLIDDMFDVREHLLNVVCIHYTCRSSVWSHGLSKHANTSHAATNRQDSDLPREGAVEYDIWNVIAFIARDTVVGVAVRGKFSKSIEIWSHIGVDEK